MWTCSTFAKLTKTHTGEEECISGVITPTRKQFRMHLEVKATSGIEIVSMACWEVLKHQARHVCLRAASRDAACESGIVMCLCFPSVAIAERFVTCLSGSSEPSLSELSESLMSRKPWVHT